MEIGKHYKVRATTTATPPECQFTSTPQTTLSLKSFQTLRPYESMIHYLKVILYHRHSERFNHHFKLIPQYDYPQK